MINHRDVEKMVLDEIESGFSEAYRRAISKVDIGDYLVLRIALRVFLARNIVPSDNELRSALDHTHERGKTSWFKDMKEMINYYKANNERI